MWFGVSDDSATELPGREGLSSQDAQVPTEFRCGCILSCQIRYPAIEIVELYHQRWEIETSYREAKSTMLHGRVLRARTPTGIAQEIYAVLIVHQALRIAIADTCLVIGDVAPDRLSFTIALTAARDAIHNAATVLAETGTDLTGRIGRTVLQAVLPPRRSRSSPRVTKRAISKHRAKGRIDRTNYPTRITTHLRTVVDSEQVLNCATLGLTPNGFEGWLGRLGLETAGRCVGRRAAT